jgi:hypothetical protein
MFLYGNSTPGHPVGKTRFVIAPNSEHEEQIAYNKVFLFLLSICDLDLIECPTGWGLKDTKNESGDLDGFVFESAEEILTNLYDYLTDRIVDWSERFTKTMDKPLLSTHASLELALLKLVEAHADEISFSLCKIIQEAIEWVDAIFEHGTKEENSELSSKN